MNCVLTNYWYYYKYNKGKRCAFEKLLQNYIK